MTDTLAKLLLPFIQKRIYLILLQSHIFVYLMICIHPAMFKLNQGAIFKKTYYKKLVFQNKSKFITEDCFVQHLNITINKFD